MQILDKNTGGVGGIDLFEEIVYVGLKAQGGYYRNFRNHVN
jgi:hypothetical protein